MVACIAYTDGPGRHLGVTFVDQDGQPVDHDGVLVRRPDLLQDQAAA
jgi:hypothetical protein